MSYFFETITFSVPPHLAAFLCFKTLRVTGKGLDRSYT